MRLYYFTATKYALDAVKHRQVKIAKIDYLNDPFDFLGINIFDKFAPKKLIETKDELSNQLARFSFREIGATR